MEPGYAEVDVGQDAEAGYPRVDDVAVQGERELLLVQGGRGEHGGLDAGDEPGGLVGYPARDEGLDRLGPVRPAGRGGVADGDDADELLARADGHASLAVGAADPAGAEAERGSLEDEALAPIAGPKAEILRPAAFQHEEAADAAELAVVS